MTNGELREYLNSKKKTLLKIGQMICVNEKTAYDTDMVPIQTTLNLQQDLIVTVIKFDKQNTTENCANQIRTRIEKKQNSVVQPISWTDQEYIIPIGTLFTILIISITINLIMCLRGCIRQIQSSGPRRGGNLELGILE